MNKIPWVKGLRPKSKSGRIWQEYIINILLDEPVLTPRTQGNTFEAEQGLCIDSCEYWYIAVANPAFNRAPMLYYLEKTCCNENSCSIKCDCGGVVDCDSGGIWHNYHDDRERSSTEKKELFNEKNMSLSAYETPFRKMLSKSPDYLNVNKNKEQRNKMWEGRISIDRCEQLIKLNKIFLTESEIDDIREFAEEKYEMPKALSIIEKLQNIHKIRAHQANFTDVQKYIEEALHAK